MNLLKTPIKLVKLDKSTVRYVAQSSSEWKRELKSEVVCIGVVTLFISVLYLTIKLTR